VVTADPFSDILRANGQWEGSLNPVDSMDEVPTYTVTDAPDHGSVQINPDGTYVYTPDEGYTGPDSFMVKAADPGFNIFDFFGPRDPEFTVTITDPNFIFPSIKNVTFLGDYQPVVVARVLYTIDWVRATRQKVAYPNRVLKDNDTYFINLADSNEKVRTPNPGIKFEYTVSITDKNKHYLWTIEVTQPEGSSITSTNVKEDLNPDVHIVEKGQSIDYWRSIRGNQYEYKIFDINGTINSTQQVQLRWFSGGTGGGI
jgi:hypothetical protein